MRITQLTTWLSKMATLLAYFEKSPAKVSIPQKHSQDEITSDEECEIHTHRVKSSIRDRFVSHGCRHLYG